jgi:hypothetical protein
MKDIRPDICMVLSGESRYPCDVTQAEWAMLSGIGLSAKWFNILPETTTPQPEESHDQIAGASETPFPGRTQDEDKE